MHSEEVVNEAGVGVFENLPQSNSNLQQILLELGLPKTKDRTVTPRKDISPRDMVICVKASPDKYLPILLEGGWRCSGHILLCLSSSWVFKSPSQKEPGLFSLNVQKAITFEAGGYTYLDTFEPPCRVTYFLEDTTIALLGEDLDCPTCGSPQLNKLTEDLLLTRQLLAQKGLGIPPTLAFSYRPFPGSWTQHPHLIVIPAQEKTQLQEAMQEAIDSFLLSSDLKTCEKVMVQFSGSGCDSLENVKVLDRKDREAVLGASLGLLPGIREGESILVTACYPSVQPLRALKLEDTAVFKAPDAVKKKFSLNIRATVCRTADDQPQATQVLCWVDRAEAHPKSSPTILQTLSETLRDWGFTREEDIASTEQLLKQWAETAINAISDHQTELFENDRGGPHAHTDFIGVDFSLTELEGSLRPLVLGIKAPSAGVHCNAYNLLNPNGLSRIVGPILQTMCHRAHCSLMAGKTLLVIGAGGSKKNEVWLTAKKFNIKIILITCNSDSPATQKVWKYFSYDYQDHSQDQIHAVNIVRIIWEQGLKVDGCLTFICSCTILTSLVCAELGLLCDTTKAITIAKMKSQTQMHLGNNCQSLQHLPDPSLYVTACVPVDDMENLPKTMDQVGFPSVMKLECSSGAVAVRLVTNIREGQEFFQKLKQAKPANDSINRGFNNNTLLMEYVGGEKYVIDLIMYRGKLLATFISKCGPGYYPFFQNTSQIMPSDSSPEKEALLATAAYQSCLHCGLENGVYNVDMKMTEQGPKLIEINPRTGGNFLPTWIQTVYGLDIIMAAFLISCDIRPHVWTPEARGFCAGISFPISQHFQAMENTPAFAETLKTLNEKGIIHSSLISDTTDITVSTSTLNLTSFGPKKEEVFQRLIIASQVLVLDSEEYSVKYFLDTLM